MAFMLSCATPFVFSPMEAEEKKEPLNSELLKRIEALEERPTTSGGNALNNIEFSVEMRGRHEYRKPETYSTTSGSLRHSDDFTQLRNRLNAFSKVSNDIDAFLQIQSLHLAGAKTLGGDSADADIQQAYFTANDFFVDDLELLLGRHSMKYGDQRLVSDLQWGAGRAWDMLRLKYRWGEGNWSDFVASTVVDGNTNLTTTANATPNSDNELYMSWNHIKLAGNKHTLDFYGMLQHDGDHNGYSGEITSRHPIGNNIGNLNRYTVGFLYKGAIEKLNYSLECDWQWGNFGSDEIDSYAYIASVNYPIFEGQTLGTTYSKGSGDKDGTDGDNKTFTAPYPFGHALYGFSDLMSLSNSEIWQFTYTNAITEKISLRLDYLIGKQHNDEDSWYTAGGAFRNASNSKKQIGEEIDVTMKYKYNKNLNFQLGYSHFMQGAMIRATETSSTRTGDQDWFYIQSVLKF